MTAIKTGLDMASVTKSLKDFDKHLKNMQQMANQNVIRIQMSNANNQINQTRQGLEGVNTQTRSFTESMGHAIKKVALFATGVSLVYGAVKKVKDALGFLNSLDTKLTDIAMITGKSKEELQEYAKVWNQLAIDTKTTTLEVASAFENYLRAGKSIDEANQMVETNIKLSRVANNTNEETAEKLIKISEAYDLNAKGVDRYANKIAYLDSTTATNSKNLLETSNGIAEIGKQTKVSEDFMLSMVSTIQERSGKAPSAVSRALKGIFLDLQKVTSDMSEDGTQAVSKLEKELSRFDISLRENATTFKSNEDIIKSLMSKYSTFDDVTQRTIQSMIGGKNFSEEFNIVMNSQNTILDRANALKSAGNSLDIKYQEHLSSTQAKLNELKATQEKFYMSILNSTAINKTIGGLTEIVKLIQYVTVENKALGATILVTASSILLITRHMAGLKNAIGQVTAFLALMKTEGLKAFGALMFNPVAIGLGALAIAITAITVGLYKNHKAVKKLTEEYNNLTKAINSADVDGQERNIQQVKKLHDELIKLKAEAKNLELNPKLDKNGVLTDVTEGKIESIISKIKKAGFTINEVTGDIKELSTVQDNINLKDKMKDIENIRDAEVNRATAIQNLIDRYNQLNSIEKRNATQQSELNVVTKQLKNSIGELNVMEDKNGNLIITNNGILATKRKALDDTKNMAVTSANAQINKERELTQVIINGTSITLAELRKRVQGYASIMKMYEIDVNNAFAKGGGSTYINSKVTEALMNADKYKKILTDIDASFTNNSNGYTGNEDGNLTPNFTPSKDSNSKEKEDIKNLENKTDRYYKLNSALQSIETELSKLNTLESNATESEKLKLKEKEIKLLDQKKIALQNIYREQQKENQSNVESLKKQGVKFDTTTGNISNKNELLNSKTNASNKLTGNAKKSSQEVIKQLEEDIKNYEDTRFSKMTDTSNKIFTLEQDRISKLAEIETAKFNQKLENIDKTYGAESQQIESIKYQLEELNATDDSSKESIKQKVELTEDLINATEDYNVTLLTGYQESLDLLNSTKKGTEEWDKANSKVEDFKTKLKSSNIELINLNKSNKDLVESKVKDLLELEKQTKELKLLNAKDKKINDYDEELKDYKKLHKAKIDNYEEEIQALNDINKLESEQEERAKRLLEIQDLQTKLNNLKILQAKELELYDNKSKEAFEENIKLQNQALEEQINALNKTNEIEDEKEERAKRLLEITKLQNDLTEVSNEKNFKQLQENADGSLEFKFIANPIKVQELNEQIAEKQKDNADWELQLSKKKHIDLLKSQIDANNKLLEENAKTLAELERKLNGSVDGILGQIKDLNKQILDKQKENDAWELSLADAKYLAKLEKEKQAEQDLITSKEESIANKKLIEENAYKNEMFLLSQHYLDMDSLVKIEMGNLSVTYGNEWDKIIDVVDSRLSELRRKYNESLALQNSISTGISNAGSSSGSKNYNGGDKDKVTIGGKTWTGAEINDPRNEEELRLANINNNNKPIKIAKFAEGGQLPLWGNQPKLAYVDEGEVINTKIDSTKLLKASEFLANVDLANIDLSRIVSSSMNNIPKFNIPQISNNTNNSPIVNNYKFGDLSFPNMTNGSDISDFMSQLSNIKHFKD